MLDFTVWKSQLLTTGVGANSSFILQKKKKKKEDGRTVRLYLSTQRSKVWKSGYSEISESRNTQKCLINCYFNCYLFQRCASCNLGWFSMKRRCMWLYCLHMHAPASFPPILIPFTKFQKPGKEGWVPKLLPAVVLPLWHWQLEIKNYPVSASTATWVHPFPLTSEEKPF